MVAAWYRDFGTELLRFCKGQMGKDDGEEVFQTVWSKAMANSEKFDGKNARAWLYRIARNTIFDMRKKRKPELSNLSAENRADESQSSLEYFIESEERARFETCMGRLEPIKQQVLRMKVLGESYKAIASKLDINIGTVGSKFNRIKEEMKNCVEGLPA